jgi:hypothetical protein
VTGFLKAKIESRKSNMNWFARHMVLAFALICLSAVVQAQPFPTGPISVVVPLALGDAADGSRIDWRLTAH